MTFSIWPASSLPMLISTGLPSALALAFGFHDAKKGPAANAKPTAAVPAVAVVNKRRRPRLTASVRTASITSFLYVRAEQSQRAHAAKIDVYIPQSSAEHTSPSQHPTGFVEKVGTDQRRVVDRIAWAFMRRLVDEQVRTVLARFGPA